MKPFAPICLIALTVSTMAFAQELQTLEVVGTDGKPVTISRDFIQAEVVKSIRKDLLSKKISANDVLVNGDGTLLVLLEPRYESGATKTPIVFAHNWKERQDLLCRHIGYQSSIEQTFSDDVLETLDTGETEFTDSGISSFRPHNDRGIIRGFKSFVSKVTCRK